MGGELLSCFERFLAQLSLVIYVGSQQRAELFLTPSRSLWLPCPPPTWKPLLQCALTDSWQPSKEKKTTNHRNPKPRPSESIPTSWMLLEDLRCYWGMLAQHLSGMLEPLLFCIVWVFGVCPGRSKGLSLSNQASSRALVRHDLLSHWSWRSGSQRYKGRITFLCTTPQIGQTSFQTLCAKPCSAIFATALAPASSSCLPVDMATENCITHHSGRQYFSRYRWVNSLWVSPSNYLGGQYVSHFVLWQSVPDSVLLQVSSYASIAKRQRRQAFARHCLQHQKTKAPQTSRVSVPLPSAVPKLGPFVARPRGLGHISLYLSSLASANYLTHCPQSHHPFWHRLCCHNRLGQRTTRASL